MNMHLPVEANRARVTARSTAWLVAAVVAAAIPAVLFHDSYLMGTFASIVIFGIVLVGLDLVIGYGELLAFSHGAFFALGAYVMGVLSARYGVPFVHNPHFVINTLAIMRGAIVAERRGELERYSEAMFYSIWRDALDMDDPAVIGQALLKYGFDAKAYFAGVQETAVKDDLKARTDAAVARGVFGLPTFFVDGKMWWGQDRLDWVKDALGA